MKKYITSLVFLILFFISSSLKSEPIPTAEKRTYQSTVDIFGVINSLSQTSPVADCQDINGCTEITSSGECYSYDGTGDRESCVNPFGSGGGGTSLTVPNCTSDQKLTGDGSVLSCSEDADTNTQLAVPSCTSDQKLTGDGSVLSCSDDIDTDLADEVSNLGGQIAHGVLSPEALDALDSATPDDDDLFLFAKKTSHASAFVDEPTAVLSTDVLNLGGFRVLFSASVNSFSGNYTYAKPNPDTKTNFSLRHNGNDIPFSVEFNQSGNIRLHFRTSNSSIFTNSSFRFLVNSHRVHFNNAAIVNSANTINSVVYSFLSSTNSISGDIHAIDFTGTNITFGHTVEASIDLTWKKTSEVGGLINFGALTEDLIPETTNDIDFGSNTKRVDNSFISSMYTGELRAFDGSSNIILHSNLTPFLHFKKYRKS